MSAHVRMAYRLARSAHAGQVDKAGQPYFDAHIAPIVREAISYGASPALQVVLLLHDVVEDTPVTLDGLRIGGFPRRTVESIDAMTQRTGESRAEYRLRVAADPGARAGKWFDHKRNTRTDGPATTDGAEAAERRRVKYEEDAKAINWCAYPKDRDGEHDHDECVAALVQEANEHLAVAST